MTKQPNPKTTPLGKFLRGLLRPLSAKEAAKYTIDRNGTIHRKPATSR